MRAPITLGPPPAELQLPRRRAGRALRHDHRDRDDGGELGLQLDHGDGPLHQIPPVGTAAELDVRGQHDARRASPRGRERSRSACSSAASCTATPRCWPRSRPALDMISGGRAFLGIGAAWFEEEHDAYGFEFPPLEGALRAPRGRLNIARAMFTRGARPPTRASTTAIDDALNNPQPLRGDIPIVDRRQRRAQDAAARRPVRRRLQRLRRRRQDPPPDGRARGPLRGRRPRPVRDHPHAAGLAVPRLQPRGRAAPRRGGQGRRLAARAPRPDGDRGRARTRSPSSSARSSTAGIEGFTISLPDPSDLEMVELAGKTIGPLVGSRVG